MSDSKKRFHIIWGIALLVVGFLMFITIPGRVKQIQEAGKYIFGLRFGLYFISVFLIVGGAKKIVDYTKSSQNKDDGES